MLTYYPLYHYHHTQIHLVSHELTILTNSGNLTPSLISLLHPTLVYDPITIITITTTSHLMALIITLSHFIKMAIITPSSILFMDTLIQILIYSRNILPPL